LEPSGFELLEVEKKYHYSWPSGRFWKDRAHSVLASLGFHSIISSCWRC
jgi:hypothetical protein